MTEDLRARMMSLNLPSAAAPGPPGGGSGGVGGNNSDLSPDFGFSSVSSTPAGSLSARPARPRPSLNMSGHMSDSGLTPSSSSSKTPRRPPGSLIFGSSISSTGPMSGGIPDKNNFNSGNLPQSSVVEQERKLNEIMNQNGLLQLNGVRVKTSIDDLELLGDLGNGTCGHVVKMRHRNSGQEIAVKQMRRTGNSDETKRILMDLDVVLKSIDCRHIVVCLGCFITASDVWICMELMSTCFDKLLKHLKQPIPEQICGKVAVSTLKALNYLKEFHGVIHRDVKPSNILLDAAGNIKLCDFGISGRLVDSKAKTRSAGCAAYMAPERIDPPNPSKPDYDIRADVWSLGITLVELATGHFPYRDCKTDFEVLTKVLQDDPPLLPTKKGFSIEFCSFVRDCLMKNYKDRPKYRKLLQHPFIQRYEKEVVDVGAWYRSHMNTAGDGVSPNNNTAAAAAAASTSNATNSQQQHSQNTTTPSSNATTTPGSASSSAMNPSPLGNQDSLDSPSSFVSPSATSQSTDHSFKPMPSPRVTRSWRPPAKIPSPTSAAASAQSAAYPSAIGDRHHHHHSPQEYSLSPRERQHESGQRRPSFEYLRQQQHQHQQYPHFDLYQPSPMSHRSTAAREKASSGSSGYCSTPYLGQTALASSRTAATGPSSLQDEHLTRPTTARYATAQGPSFDRSAASGYSSSSSRADPLARGAPKKFEFTFPNSNLPPSGSERGGSSSTSPSYHHSAADSLYHQYRTGLTFNTGAGGGSGLERRGDGTATDEVSSHRFAPASRQPPQHYLENSAQERERRTAAYSWLTTRDTGRQGRPPTRPAAASTASDQPHDRHQQPSSQQRSPSQERTAAAGSSSASSASSQQPQRSYFPSWRTLSSYASSFQSPISLRRLRTASTDRSAAFDHSRRFQPSYRSWNERDNNPGGGMGAAPGAERGAPPGAPGFYHSMRR